MIISFSRPWKESTVLISATLSRFQTFSSILILLCNSLRSTSRMSLVCYLQGVMIPILSNVRSKLSFRTLSLARISKTLATNFTINSASSLFPFDFEPPSSANSKSAHSASVILNATRSYYLPL